MTWAQYSNCTDLVVKFGLSNTHLWTLLATRKKNKREKEKKNTSFRNHSFPGLCSPMELSASHSSSRIAASHSPLASHQRHIQLRINQSLFSRKHPPWPSLARESESHRSPIKYCDILVFAVQLHSATRESSVGSYFLKRGFRLSESPANTLTLAIGFWLITSAAREKWREKVLSVV